MEKDKYTAQKKYAKSNIKKLSCSFKKEFVDFFADSCIKFNIKQSDVIRKAMQDIIDQAKNG